MNALEFAKMFVEDIPETLNGKNEVELFFDLNTLNDDPELKILQQEVNKAGYNLIPQENKKFQYWKLTKF